MSAPTTEPSAATPDAAPAEMPVVEGGELPSMPDSSIAAATQALNSALEAANIVADEPETALPAGAQDGDIDGDAKVKTVFDDAEAFNVKHPLYSPWTLWYDSPQTARLPKPASTPVAQTPNPAAGGWMDNVRPVVSFNSVEEFWGLYNNIVPPSQLPAKANYYLFKESIIPAWEDAANKDGGKWAVQMPRDKTREKIDKMWLYTMLAAIGETFEAPLPSAEAEQSPLAHSPDLITGVLLSTRPNFYRLAIWTRHSPGPEAEAAKDEILKRITLVGKNFKTAVLGFDEDARLFSGFQTEVEWVKHTDSEKKDKKSIRKIVA